MFDSSGVDSILHKTIRPPVTEFAEKKHIQNQPNPRHLRSILYAPCALRFTTTANYHAFYAEQNPPCSEWFPSLAVIFFVFPMAKSHHL